MFIRIDNYMNDKINDDYKVKSKRKSSNYSGINDDSGEGKETNEMNEDGNDNKDEYNATSYYKKLFLNDKIKRSSKDTNNVNNDYTSITELYRKDGITNEVEDSNSAEDDRKHSIFSLFRFKSNNKSVISINKDAKNGKFDISNTKAPSNSVTSGNKRIMNNDLIGSELSKDENYANADSNRILNSEKRKDHKDIKTKITNNIISDKNDKLKRKLNNSNLILTNKNSNSTSSISNQIELYHSHKEISYPVIYETLNSNEKSKTNIVYNYFQVSKYTIKNNLLMKIIQMLWGNMFHFYLKSVEQLGTNVSADKEILDNYLYFVFEISSTKYTPQKLNLEIDKVLALVKAKIEDLSKFKLSELKEVLRFELNKRDNNLKQKSDFIWKQIYELSPDFEVNETVRHELKGITIKEVKDFFENVFIIKPRKLSIHVYSKIFKKVMEDKDSKLMYYYLNSNINLVYTSDLNILDKINSA